MRALGSIGEITRVMSAKFSIAKQTRARNNGTKAS